uniref:tRNA (adenine(58)-N(1))-methyltransferase n=1 Tax=Strigamia maritima TaxID=126957 RepID=T1J461_STRMM
MSFSTYKQEMSVGDTVVVYLSVNNVYSIVIKAGEVFQTKYGALKHDDLIGREFGKKVQCSRGWVYVLHPTPELWTLTLPHRTQILYTPDISLITLYLELGPGSKVCEAGTGSGSLSHAILRTIYPDGHLYTFDFHAQRVEVAKQEFVQHGFEQMVTAQSRDVVSDGFGMEGIVDAVFLDLPLPWEVVPSAAKVMKLNGKEFFINRWLFVIKKKHVVCSFSQLQHWV